VLQVGEPGRPLPVLLMQGPAGGDASPVPR